MWNTEWILMSDKKPEDEQNCLTKMKHGIIEGYYNAEENIFHGYYWTTLEWHATEWLPIEQVI